MLHPSTRRLIEKLDEMTRKQRVTWDECDDGSVTHDTEGYRVSLTPEPHTMRLTDALGREIETCTPQDFAGETDASGRPFAEFVSDLFREAHRHARGAEKAISVLLSSLDEADTTGAAPAEPEPEPESFDHAEDAGDDSRPLEDHELPEIDDDEHVKEAVAAMADEVNRPVEAPAPFEATPEPEIEPVAVAEPEPEPAAEAQPFAAPFVEPAPEFEPEPEPVAFEPETIPEPAVEAAPEPTAYAPFAGSTEDAQAYATAAAFEAPVPAEPPEPELPEPELPESATAELEAPAVESEAFAAGNDIWDAIQSAGPEQGDEPVDLGALAAEPEAPEAVAQPETPVQAEEPPPAPAEPQPTTSSNFFTGGLGDISRYRTEPPAAPAPELEPAEEAAPAPAEPQPEPAPAPPPQRFSLSGITSGFGLGSTHPATRTPPAAEPAPETPAEAPPERVVIDGTADLPDVMPESEPHSGYRMEEDQEFGFTEADLMPGVPASPLPAASEPAEAAPTPAPEESAPEDQTDEETPETPRRFNPWN